METDGRTVGLSAPAGTPGFNSPASSSRLSLNASVQVSTCFPSIQLLGLEMLLHCFHGPEVVALAARNKLVLSLGERRSHSSQLDCSHPFRRQYSISSSVQS